MIHSSPPLQRPNVRAVLLLQRAGRGTTTRSLGPFGEPSAASFKERAALATLPLEEKKPGPIHFDSARCSGGWPDEDKAKSRSSNASGTRPAKANAVQRLLTAQLGARGSSSRTRNAHARPASVSESASSVLPIMTRLDATEVKDRTKTRSSSSAPHRAHAQLDRFRVLADEGMKVGPMTLNQRTRREADSGAFDFSHEGQGVVDSSQTMAHGERQAVGQTFPSVVVGLAPDEGRQKFGGLVKTMLAEGETIRARVGPENVLCCSSESTASFSARGWSDKRLAT